MNFRKLFQNHRTFIWSDQHWGHSNILKFTRADGVTPLRPLWNDVDEMNSALVNNHNNVVAADRSSETGDVVIFLGDLSMKASVLESIMPRLVRCHTRILIKGNHDNASHDFYKRYFNFVLPMLPLNGTAIMTHIPIHPDSIGRYGVNIHGHLHDKVVLDMNGNPDPRYINVSVEQTNFRPVLLQSIVGDLSTSSSSTSS